MWAGWGRSSVMYSESVPALGILVDCELSSINRSDLLSSMEEWLLVAVSYLYV